MFVKVTNVVTTLGVVVVSLRCWFATVFDVEL